MAVKVRPVATFVLLVLSVEMTTRGLACTVIDAGVAVLVATATAAMLLL
ncbi:MAG: hypothetical protein FD127_4536 [Acidimicrobiaceae bacterium]|nr:MAG: hypothetical protein FD127_4536 [Acidimicrobiaceae bacterium]